MGEGIKEMTCIIGYKTKDGELYMAGDRYISESNFTLGHPKIFKKRDVIFGVTGYLLILNDLQYIWELPVKLDKETNLEYIYGRLIVSMRTFLKEKYKDKNEMDDYILNNDVETLKNRFLKINGLQRQEETNLG